MKKLRTPLDEPFQKLDNIKVINDIKAVPQVSEKKKSMKAHFVFANPDNGDSDLEQSPLNQPRQLSKPKVTKKPESISSSSSSALSFEDDLVKESPHHYQAGILLMEAAGLDIAKNGKNQHKRHQHGGVLFRPLKKKQIESNALVVHPGSTESFGITGMKRLQIMIEGAIKREEVASMHGSYYNPLKKFTPSREDRESRFTNMTNLTGPIIKSRMAEDFLEENFFENEKEYTYKGWSRFNRRSKDFSLKNKIDKSSKGKKVSVNDFTDMEKRWKKYLEKLKVSHITKDVCLDYEYSPDYCFNSMVDIFPLHSDVKPVIEFIEDKEKDTPIQKHIYKSRLLKFPRDTLFCDGEFPQKQTTINGLSKQNSANSQTPPTPLPERRVQLMTPSEIANMQETTNRKQDIISTEKHLEADSYSTIHLANSYRTRKHFILNKGREMAKEEKRVEKKERRSSLAASNLTLILDSIGVVKTFRGRRGARRMVLSEQMNLNIVFDKYMNDFVEIDKKHIKKPDHLSIKRLYAGILKEEKGKPFICGLNWSGEQVLNRFDFPEYKTFNVIHYLNNQDIDIYLRGIKGAFATLRKKAGWVLDTSTQNTLMNICTVVNLSALMTEGLFSYEINNALALVNFYISFVYFYEFLLKILHLGPTRYLRTFSNCLDCLVVVTTAIEVVYKINGYSDGSTLLSATRAARLFRVLSRLRFMKVISAVVLQTAEQYLYVLLIELLLMFIFALLGMQIFGGEFIYDGNIPRGNFDTLGASLFTLFQLLTQENWTDILQACYSSQVPKIVTLFYIFAWLLLGSYLIFNLFLALLLGGFDSMDVHAILYEVDDEYKQILTSIERDKNQKAATRKVQEDKLNKQYKDIMFICEETKKQGGELIEEDGIGLLDHDQYKSRACYFPIRNTIDDESSLDDLLEKILESKLAPKNISAALDQNQPMYRGIESDKSLGIFARDNPIRWYCAAIVSSVWFERLVIFIILLSSVKLVVETYLNDVDRFSGVVQVFQYVEYGYATMFTIESIMKIIRQGLVSQKGTYLRDPWSSLELLIIFGSWSEIIFRDNRISTLKVLSANKAIKTA